MTSQTFFFIFKTILSGILIAVISSLAKTFPKWAAFITALPIMTFLSLIWIYIETKDLALLSSYSKDVLLWVLPSPIFFFMAYYLFRQKVPFLATLTLSTASLGLGLLIFQKMNILK